MELKIKIKEVKVEKRHLTIEEWAVYLLSENENSVYQHAAEDIIKSWGLIAFENGLIGFFHTETIRNATPEEHRAWAYLQLTENCTCPENKTKTSSLDCDDCFLSGACIASEFKAGHARYILKDKEIILESV